MVFWFELATRMRTKIAKPGAAAGLVGYEAGGIQNRNQKLTRLDGAVPT